MHELTFFPAVVLSIGLFYMDACNSSSIQNQQNMNDAHPYTNHLINESSPYLLQHAHNPVDWHPWRKETLEKAKQENKLIIISIGYAACHWCHVMEHESFEDTAVAKVMNDHFISIKVDREERPDIDQIYMDACNLITGRGGWPLNAIALPDGRPIYAGTYFPKQQWMSLLNQINSYYQKDPGDAEQRAQQITEGIKSVDAIEIKVQEQEFKLAELKSVFQGIMKNMDFEKGGRQGAPKFPMPVNYEFLLTYYHLTKDQSALKATQVTLENVANGGIYDHIGGGFARYSVDAEWHVPHFEKMLYDNGQLVSLYAEAYKLTKDPLYKNVVYETLEWVAREMTTAEGGFYSSLDADSEGEEGKFYVWTHDEIENLLGEDAALFNQYYDISKHGNWEHNKNVLRRITTEDEVSQKNHLSINELKEKIKALKAVVLAEREKRIRPGLDDKILTSWNALMLKGYVDAYRAFGEERFLKKAIDNAEFILDKVSAGDKLFRNYKNGQATIDAFLDDYALAIDAFIALYQATFDERWIQQADKWTRYVIDHFYDEESGMFFYTGNDHEELIARKKEISDNVIPSSSSVMAKNLFIMGQYLYNEDYLHMSRQMLTNVKASIEQHPAFYANWAVLFSWFVEEPFEVAIVGTDFKSIRQEWDQHHLPNAFLLGGVGENFLPLLNNKLVEGQTTIYVCRNKTCQLPVTTVDAALKQME